MIRSAIIALACLGAALPLRAQDLLGTYSFNVCRTPCNNDPSNVVASGRFVLFPDTASLNRALTAAAVTLSPRSRFYEFYGADLRACFAAGAQERQVNGVELYVGIHPSGRTTWRFEQSEFSVKLYQSPDASAHLVGRVHGDSIVGINRQLQCCGRGYMEVGHFTAVRIGPPRAESCATD